MHRLITYLLPPLVVMFAAVWSATASTYHVDSFTGSDTNSGTAPDRPWKSVDRVNGATFQPGDVILFRAGTRYVGQLKPTGSGSQSNGVVTPIRIGTYGEGARPRIDGEGQVLDTLLLRNMECWEVAGLEITNLGEDREPWRTGVRILNDGGGTLHHIVLTNLHVHDVNGDLRKSHEGCGIFFESRGRGARFENLRIENCHVVRTDRNGICQRTGNSSRSTGVIIRGNLLENVGGDGIKVWGSNGAIIEYNVLRGGRMRCQDAAAGIWPWDCDDTLIQFNEVSGMRGTRDGQGFDSDYRCRNSVFQYNYSHDNEGGFMLICSPGNSYNEGTIIRYNISQNDGINSARTFHFAGGVSNTMVCNNTFYVGPRQNLPLLLFTEWDDGNAANTRFFNNLFWVDGEVRYEFGESTTTVFDHNLFFGNHQNPPADGHAMTNHPPLTAPGTGANGLGSLDGYRPKTSATFPRGRVIRSNGGRDFFGVPLPADRPPCVGAAEQRE